MERRLVEPLERWLLDWPVLALAVALVVRIAQSLLLWGGLKQSPPSLGIIESQLLAVLLVAALLGLVRSFVPREYAAACGVFIGTAAWWLALELLPRYGLLVKWPLGHLPPLYLALAGGLLAASSIAQALLGLRWRSEIRGHGVEWTRNWADRRPYAARKLALRALRYMGEWDAQ